MEFYHANPGMRFTNPDASPQDPRAVTMEPCQNIRAMPCLFQGDNAAWPQPGAGWIEVRRMLHATPFHHSHVEQRNVESFGVMDEENRQYLRKQVRITVELSSQPVHMVYPQRIAALEGQIGYLSKALEKANISLEILVRTVTGKANRQLLLHESFVGVTSETSDDEVTIKYNREGDLEGEDIVQYYRREQFNAHRPVPSEGVGVEAYVFVMETPESPGATTRDTAAGLLRDDVDRFAGFGSEPRFGDVEM